MIKMKTFPIYRSLDIAKFLIETLMDEVKPVVTQSNEIEVRIK